MIVGIIGAGAWGTGLAHLVARGGNDVILWSFDGEYAHFDAIDLPQKVTLTSEMIKLKNCDTWVAVTPAAFFRTTMLNAAKVYNNQPIIICTKGAELQTGKFMTEVLNETIKPTKQNIGVLSGPQFAAEVARNVPTGSTLAGSNKIWKQGGVVFNKLYLEYSRDVLGTQLCGVGKNAVSVIAGYINIAGGGENETAMVMTRAWNEIINLGQKIGAKRDTFSGLCGLGDLLLTATSRTSRNFSAGIAIANGEKPTGTIEGISALAAIIKRAKENDVDTPILTKMYNILSK